MDHNEVADAYAEANPDISRVFDPGRYLTSIKGQEYLEVKWRIAWLRAEHPAAVLTTELYSHENGRAIFSAHVSFDTPADADGVIGSCTATGWGSEHVDNFANYIEKAETKAIGRALAHAGFGTQFAGPDIDGETPVASSGGYVPRDPVPNTLGGGRPGSGHAQDDAMSEKAQTFFRDLSVKNNVREEEVGRAIRDMFGKQTGLAGLTRREGARLTNEWLKPRVGWVDKEPRR